MKESCAYWYEAVSYVKQRPGQSFDPPLVDNIRVASVSKTREGALRKCRENVKCLNRNFCTNTLEVSERVKNLCTEDADETLGWACIPQTPETVCTITQEKPDPELPEGVIESERSQRNFTNYVLGVSTVDDPYPIETEAREYLDLYNIEINKAMCTEHEQKDCTNVGVGLLMKQCMALTSSMRSAEIASR